MNIGEVPMKCALCGHCCELADADCDDPFGDGRIGCPVTDCGGEMIIDESKVDTTTRPYTLK